MPIPNREASNPDIVALAFALVVFTRNQSDMKTLKHLRRNNPCYKPPDNQTLSKTAKQLEKRIFKRRVKVIIITLHSFFFKNQVVVSAY